MQDGKGLQYSPFSPITNRKKGRNTRILYVHAQCSKGWGWILQEGGVACIIVFKMASKWPREYPRVPSLEEVEPGDFVGIKKARDQAARDR